MNESATNLNRKSEVKRINSKILSSAVIKKTDEPEVTKEVMTEDIARPEMLVGSTYKVKTPLSEHAMYITINDIVLNQGTIHEERRPFEIFINSKSMDNFQWVVALTRLVSAVWRKGGDCIFLVEELKAVFDPKGGYFKPGGKFMPSLVADIGSAIEEHLIKIDLIEKAGLDKHQQNLVEQKKVEYETLNKSQKQNSGYPEGATLCGKCSTVAVVLMDGCGCCLSCGDSKCG